MRIPSILAFTLLAAVAPAQADKASECTKTGLCYCVESGVRKAVDDAVAKVRGEMAEAKKAGKAVGYMSAPVSTAGGGHSGVNGDVATGVRAMLDKRFGAGRLYLTDPTLSLPNEARGEDYMLMWTLIFEGPTGLGEDFDFVYFTGPADFARTLGLTGTDDMARIDAYFDERIKTDASLQRAVSGNRLTRDSFRTYYAFKASVAFSRGSSDEWNIVSAINDRRRADKTYGIPNQIAILYNGGGIQPGSIGAKAAEGYTGKCP
jgi:hypothetical protein